MRKAGILLCLLGMGYTAVAFVLDPLALSCVHFPLFAFLLVALYRHPWDFFRRFRQFRWVNHGRCGNCGYDLTGNTSGVCPECGMSAKANGG